MSSILKSDLKHIGLPDEKVYTLAAQLRRLIVTYNEKDFKPLAPQSNETGVIGVTSTTPYAIVDKKLTALLTKSSEKALRGKFTVLLQTEQQAA